MENDNNKELFILGKQTLLGRTFLLSKKAEANAAQWQAAYEDLKQRALKAYYKQQEEIEYLKKQLGK